MIPREILDMYKEKQLYKNDICNKCKAQAIKETGWISKPLAIWHVGKGFASDRYKILFIGKPHRESHADEFYMKKNISEYLPAENCLKMDSTYQVSIAENLATRLFFKKRWAYWSYTKALIKSLYSIKDDAEAWEKIAITNIVKCTISMGNDGTSDIMKKSCIDDLGIIWREIELLKPKNIIFYTGRDYDNYLQDYTLKKHLGTDNIELIEDKSNKIGQKDCRFWYRKVYLKNEESINVLVVGHPQYMKKDQYLEMIKNWLIDSS